MFSLGRAYLSYRNFKFKIVDHQFVLKKGIIKKSNTSIAFDRIQNINFKQNLIQQFINVFLYGKDRNFNFNAIQLEFPFPDLRDTQQSRNTFASAFVNLIQKYIQIHTGIDIFKTD